MEKLVYTVKEFAQILNIGMNTAYQLIHENKIPHIKLGRKIMIPKKGLEDWIVQSVNLG